MTDRGEGDMPSSVTLRPHPLDRYMRLVPIPMGVSYLLTHPPGELLWFAGGALVVLGILAGIVVWSQRMVMTRDALVKRSLLVHRTYPLTEVTVHDHKDRVDIRHNGGRLLLRLFGQGKVSLLWRHHVPTGQWKIALETMQAFLDAAKQASDAPHPRRFAGRGRRGSVMAQRQRRWRGPGWPWQAYERRGDAGYNVAFRGEVPKMVLGLVLLMAVVGGGLLLIVQFERPDGDAARDPEVIAACDAWAEVRDDLGGERLSRSEQARLVLEVRNQAQGTDLDMRPFEVISNRLQEGLDLGDLPRRADFQCAQHGASPP